MTALAQGMAGLALVMAFALLCIRQIRAASILLAVQSASVAVSSLALHQPLMALPPLLLAAATWFAPAHIPNLQSRTTPLGGAKLGVTIAALLAVLCQSQGVLALPLAVVLLSILMAATRRHPLMHVMALVGVQNGIALAACLIISPEAPAALLLPLCCLALPLPTAIGLFGRTILPLWHGKSAAWIGWIDLAIALAIFAATILVPLDPLASAFAPLLALDGIFRSCHRLRRQSMSLLARAAALSETLFAVLAVWPPNLELAWLALLPAIMASVLPRLTRRWDNAVLAFCGAGIALCGLLFLTFTPSPTGFLGIFLGFATVAAVVPDLAAVLAVLLLRLAIQEPWPPAAEVLGLGIAVAALLASALMLRGKSPRSSRPRLQQALASIAALCICLGIPDGRFAALVLLTLVVLTRAAARLPDGPAGSLAIAGLGGVPPLGVFPGLVLAILAIAGHATWLLLPLGIAWIIMLLASLPHRLHLPRPRARSSEINRPLKRKSDVLPSLAWLPFALAIAAGYFAPEGLVRWWHLIAAGHG